MNKPTLFVGRAIRRGESLVVPIEVKLYDGRWLVIHEQGPNGKWVATGHSCRAYADLEGKVLDEYALRRAAWWAYGENFELERVRP